MKYDIKRFFIKLNYQCIVAYKVFSFIRLKWILASCWRAESRMNRGTYWIWWGQRVSSNKVTESELLAQQSCFVEGMPASRADSRWRPRHHVQDEQVLPKVALQLLLHSQFEQLVADVTAFSTYRLFRGTVPTILPWEVAFCVIRDFLCKFRTFVTSKDVVINNISSIKYEWLFKRLVKNWKIISMNFTYCSQSAPEFSSFLFWQRKWNPEKNQLHGL